MAKSKSKKARANMAMMHEATTSRSFSSETLVGIQDAGVSRRSKLRKAKAQRLKLARKIARSAQGPFEAEPSYRFASEAPSTMLHRLHPVQAAAPQVQSVAWSLDGRTAASEYDIWDKLERMVERKIEERLAGYGFPRGAATLQQQQKLRQQSFQHPVQHSMQNPVQQPLYADFQRHNHLPPVAEEREPYYDETLLYDDLETEYDIPRAPRGFEDVQSPLDTYHVDHITRHFRSHHLFRSSYRFRNCPQLFGMKYAGGDQQLQFITLPARYSPEWERDGKLFAGRHLTTLPGYSSHVERVRKNELASVLMRGSDTTSFDPNNHQQSFRNYDLPDVSIHQTPPEVYSPDSKDLVAVFRPTRYDGDASKKDLYKSLFTFEGWYYVHKIAIFAARSRALADSLAVWEQPADHIETNPQRQMSWHRMQKEWLCSEWAVIKLLRADVKQVPPQRLIRHEDS